MAKRQGCITALVSQLSQISIANGYETDLGARVFEWRVTQIPPAQCPAIEIRDSDSDVLEDNNNVLTDSALAVAIIAYDTPTEKAAELGRKYIRDIKKAIKVDLQLNGNAYQIDDISSPIEVQQESEISLAATVNILVHCRTEKWSD